MSSKNSRTGVRESWLSRIFNIINVIIMTFFIVICVYPVMYVVFCSLSDPVEIAMRQGMLIKPLGFSIDAYVRVINYPMISKGYLNTLFIVVVGVSVNIILTSIGAYFLSRKDVFFQKYVMLFILVTMFFGGGLIPFYFTVKGIGLYDTLWALILPAGISTFNMIILRTAFYAIPTNLEESAILDGAGNLIILTRIIIPLSLPTISVLILYYGVGHWNSWFNAMIFLQNRSLFPLQLVLREILLLNDTGAMTVGVGASDAKNVSETVQYAVIVVATLPILCIYPFLQKYFVKGVMVGAVKG